MSRLLFIIILLLNAPALFGQVHLPTQRNQFRLSEPQLIYSSLFFRDSLEVRLDFRQPGAIINYFLDDDRQNFNQQIYSQPFIFKKSTTLTSIASHPDFLPSPLINERFIKAREFPEGTKVAFKPMPDPPYDLIDPAVLINFKGGTTVFHEGKEWLGFRKDSVSVTLTFPEMINIENICVSFLRDQKSWIFLPDQVELWAAQKRIGKKQLHEREHQLIKDSYQVSIPSKSFKTDTITIKIFGIKTLPDWHSAAGEQPWIFIDEILLTEK